ncbi:hypothetical protein KI387_006320, partial [Taxus chinensis]
DIVLELLGEPGLEAHFNEEDSKEVQLECACMEKEKGKLVYLIDGEEVEKLDVKHTMVTCEVMDSDNEKAISYHEPMKTKNVDIGSE